MKTNRVFGAALGAALAIALAPSVQAEEIGEAEYMEACASCHGPSSKGDGPLAELMTMDVPSLTGLSAANDGAFPMLEVIQVIDGRTGVRGHGYPMPVWGSRYKAEAMEAGEYAAEIDVRGRVLSLALYIQSIQE
mgnify:FL=1